MASVNKWIGIGHLGSDPELKHTSSGQAVCNLSVACNETWKDKSGQKQDRTEWVRVTVWGVQAENCAKYLNKGSPVYVEGRLQTRSWDDKDGKKRYSTDIRADRVQFLGGKGTGGTAPSRSDTEDPSGGYEPEQPPGDDDIPF